MIKSATEVRPLYAGQPLAGDHDASNWCLYVAGMVGAYLKLGVDDPKIPVMALVIERRLWALRQPPASDREPLTEEQVAEACGWKADMGCKPLPRELRIARAIEAAHGITAPKEEA